MKSVRQIFEWLCRKYVQSADERQRGMGLQYMTAETHDLAEELHRWLMADGDAVMEPVVRPKRYAAPVGEWSLQQRTEADQLARLQGAMLRAGMAHNNGAKGTWVIVGNREQLLAMYRELIKGWRPS